MKEGFDDIRAHQIAMVAGMRAAFEKLIRNFDPEILEQQWRQDKGGLLPGLTGKGKNWDKYKQMYSRITRDSSDNFQRMFGEEFARAYEEQMHLLTRGR